MRVDTAACIHKEKMYICCGWSGNYLNDFWCFDFNTLEWKSLPNLPISVTSGRNFSDGNFIYFHGGYNSDFGHSSSIFRFDFHFMQWLKVDFNYDKEISRTSHFIFLYSDHVFLFILYFLFFIFFFHFLFIFFFFYSFFFFLFYLFFIFYILFFYV